MAIKQDLEKINPNYNLDPSLQNPNLPRNGQTTIKINKNGGVDINTRSKSGGNVTGHSINNLSEFGAVYNTKNPDKYLSWDGLASKYGLLAGDIQYIKSLYGFDKAPSSSAPRATDNTPGAVASSGSSFPKPGETVGDLFTNASNGATYNWRTGALVHDPSGTAIASGQGGSNNSLPTAQAPTSAGGVNSVGGINMPTTTPGTGNISNAVAGTSGASSYIETQEKIAADRQKQVEANLKTLQTTTAPLLERLMGSTSPTEAREDAQDETGIDPEDYFADQKKKIAEIESLTKEYNNTKAIMEQQIAATGDKLASNNFINNQIAQIQRNAAPKLNEMSANINAKAATMEALQGNFNEAQTFVNQAVQDATAEFKYNYDVFSTFYEMNRDIITALDEPYQKAYESALKLSEVAYEQSVKDKTAVGEMMIDPALRGAGITINDTLEQAYVKAAKVAGSNYLADKAKASTPSPSAPKTYTIASGDTLYNIAQKKGILLNALIAANPSVDANNLRKGQVINLPTSSTVNTPTNVELTQFINQQMATPEFKALSKADKKLYVQSQGGNPADFGL